VARAPLRTASAEAELDRKIEELIAKLVEQNLTDGEEARLSQLVAQRSRKMRRVLPLYPRRFARLRLTA
jgi:hypothetical protein